MKKILLYMICSLLPFMSVSQQWPRNPSFKQVRLGGESKKRVVMSYDFLKQAVHSLADSVKSHPGDAHCVAEAARVAHALSIEAMALGEHPAELDSLMSGLTAQFNGHGYWGAPAGSKLDEGQLACNGLLLKALCGYYRYHRSDSLKQRISQLAHHMFAQNIKGLKRYTLSPRTSLWSKLKFWDRKGRGWRFSQQRGELLEAIGGLVQAYEVLNDSLLVPVVDVLVHRAQELSPKLPVHYLTAALRAQLQWAEMTADAKLATWVQQRYDRLVQEKLTASFEIAACDSVTSVSATADAFMLANDLWRFSGDTRYLELLQLIYCNAFVTMQLSNGSLVPHNIPTASNPFLRAMPQSPVESLSQGAEALANYDRMWAAMSNDTVYINYFTTAVSGFRGAKSFSMIQSSTYPADERSMSLMMLKAPEDELTWKVFIPHWLKDVKFKVSEEPDTVVNPQLDAAVVDASGYLTFRTAFVDYGVVNMEFADSAHVETLPALACRRALAGPSLLGLQTDSIARLPANMSLQQQSGRWKVKNSGRTLSPVVNIMPRSLRDPQSKLPQVLFHAP